MKKAALVSNDFKLRIVLGGATLVASLSMSLASIALPALGRAFELPLSKIQWVVVAYLVSLTTTIVIAGWFGDRFGHYRVFVAGLAVFSVSSFVCAASSAFALLVSARAAQGIGGAILLSMPLSIFRNTLAEHKIGSAMGLIATMSALGTTLGASLGGILIAALNWRVAFLLVAASGAIIFILAMNVYAGSDRQKPDNTKPMDLPGIVLLTVSLAAFAFATVEATAYSVQVTAFSCFFAFAAMAAFVLVEIRSPSPLIDMTILRHGSLSASLLSNLIVTTIMMSTIVVGPIYLVFGLGLNEAFAGVVIAAGPLTAALCGIPAGRLTDRFGYSHIVLAGLIQVTLGLFAIAILPTLCGVAGYIMALILLTPGFQMFLTSNTTMAMMSCQPENRGLVSGLLGLSRNLGFMTGASVVASVFAVVVGDNSGDAFPAAVQNAFSTILFGAAGMSVLALFFSYLGKRN